jgi:TP901 family phage tail tape measure protein
MSKQTTSIKVYIDDREAGKSLKELRATYAALKKEITDGSATGKSLNQLNSEFQKISKSIDDAEKELKKFNLAGENKFTLTEQIKQLKAEFKAAGNDIQLAAEKMKMLAEAEAKLKRIDSIISGDKNKAQGNIAAVRKEVTMLNRAIETQLVPGTKEYEAALLRLAQGKQILEQHRNKIREIEDSLRETAQSGSFNDLKAQYDKLEKEVDELVIGTEEYRNKIQELQALDRQINQHERQVRGVGKAWEFIKGELKSFGMIALGALGIGALTSQIGNLITKSAELSDAMADVERTTDLASTQVKELYDEFKGFNTRTPRSELLQLASAAGKMGIQGKEDIKNFVEEANKIKVALGADLGDDAITKIAKVTEVFKVAEQEGIMLGDAMTKVGNTINQLGMSSTAKEGYITDFIFRLGGIATQAGISVDQVAALGATLDQLGLTSEVSSTALSQTITDMAINYQQYAEIAGMAADDFNRLLKEDSMEAFTLFLEGLNNSSDGLGMMGGKLKDLSIDGVRGISVLTSLAKNTKILRDSVKVANDEYTKGNSMLAEYNKRNENFAASLERVSRWIGEKFLNSSFIKSLQDGIMWMDKLTRVTDAETKALQKQQTELFLLQAQLYRTNTPQAERVKIINELKALYPQHLANINAETATNEQLRGALKAVNDEMINKIILAREDEKITKQNETVATRLQKLLETERAALEEMSELRLKYKIETPEGAEVIDQVRKFYNDLYKATDKVGKARGGIGDPINELGKLMRELSFNTNAYNRELANSNAMLEAKEDLMKRLGITETQTPPPLQTLTPTAPPLDPTDPAATEKAKKEYKDFADHLIGIRREILLASLDSNQRELEEIYDKYQKEIQAVQEAKAEVLKAEDLSNKEKLAKSKQYSEDIAQLQLLMTLEYQLMQEKQAKARLDAFKKSMDEENKARKANQDKIQQEADDFEKTLSELGLTERQKKIKASQDYFDALEKQATDYYYNYLQLTGANEEELTNILEKIRAERAKALEAIDTNDKSNPWTVNEDFANLGMQGKIPLKELKQIKQELENTFGKTEGERLFKEFFEPFVQGRLDLIDSIAGITSAFTGAMTELFQVMGAEGERFAAFHKSMGFMMILADSAAAMAGAIKSAFADGTPSVIAKIGLAAAAIGVVVSGMARAKALISTAGTPTYADGGDTGPGTYTDHTGEKVAGIVHANEYVIPRWMRSIPAVANTVKILESIRTNKRYEAGGNVSSTLPTSMPGSNATDSTSPVTIKLSYEEKLVKLLTELSENGVSVAWDKIDKTTSRIKSIDKDA